MLIINFLNSISPGGGEGEAVDVDLGSQSDVTAGDWVAGLSGELARQMPVRGERLNANDEALLHSEDDHAQLLADIGTKKALDDDLTASLKAAIDAFAKGFA